MSFTVLKYGGSLLDDVAQQAALLDQIAMAARAGLSLILVHGGGKEISRQMEKAGLTPRFVNGRRFTDEATMTVVENALAALNADIVSQLVKRGIPARGLSGRMNHVVEAEAQPDLGRVGLPTKVDGERLSELLKLGGVPVFYSVAEDAAHHPLNINADDFALELAVACRADDLIFLTDTGGILDAEGVRLDNLTAVAVDRLIEKGTIHGGMMVKARSCLDALRRGVRRVRIGKMLHLTGRQVSIEAGTGFIPN
jgi:acetylglutamate kinase